MADRVGFIGLGTMGSRMAANLARDGFELVVYDRIDEQAQAIGKLGAKVARSVRELAEQVDVVEIAVRPASEVAKIVLGPDGICDSAKPGTIVDSHSEILPAEIQRVADEAERRGIRLLDAQMSGGAQGVEERSLCFMVGGDPAILERCRPIMGASGTEIFYLGPVGSGAVAKISQNTILSGSLVATSEGFSLAKAYGLDLDAFQALIRVSAAQSRIADGWLETWATRVNPEAYRHTLDTALAMADEKGMDLPAATLTRKLIPKILGPREL